MAALRHADLFLLAAALPVFVATELPLTAYAAAALVWLAQRAAQAWANRRTAALLAGGERRAALGTVAATTLARVWLVALAILLIGVVGERETGLVAAVLVAALFTAYLAGEAIARLVLGGER